MLKQFFAAIGYLTSVRKRSNPAVEGFSPYDSEATNQLYNLLFCDKVEVFRRARSSFIEAGQHWDNVLAAEPDAAIINAIAADKAQDSRLRALAFHRLRELGQITPAKQLFGVIIELRVSKGLDTLAAYADGHVRYFNHAGKTSAYEAAAHGWMPKVYKLLSASQAAVDLIGPWDKLRLASPAEGHVRMTFLVSDGLYFGEGPVPVMEQDEMAKPIIAAGLQLLKLIVAQSDKDDAAAEAAKK